jgi:hypothetical protein
MQNDDHPVIDCESVQTSNQLVETAPEAASNSEKPKSKNLDRRTFISRTAIAGLFAGGLFGMPNFLGKGGTALAQTNDPVCPSACELVPYTSGTVRADAAKQRRFNAAIYERNMDIPSHPCNQDEQIYGQAVNFFASYTKGLKRADGTAGDFYGEVDPAVYCTLLRALDSGNPLDFELVTLGFSNSCGDVNVSDDAARLGMAGILPPNRQRRLESPQAGYNFDLEGKDYYQLINRPNQIIGSTDPPVAFPPAFQFSSALEAVEIIENYWQALTRDVPFTEYHTNTLVQQAATDLSNFSTQNLYRGPVTSSNTVSTGLYSRGILPGDTAGPYISQFLIRDEIPYGAQIISSRIKSPKPFEGNDFLTEHAEWLMIQKGQTPDKMTIDGGIKYIRNGRDLAEYVRNDAIYQAYLNAALLLMTPPPNRDVRPDFRGGLGVPLNPNNPYRANATGIPQRYCKQLNFVEFGPSQLLSLLGEVSVRAHKAVWYQKWQVHRRLRPEEFGGRVHFYLSEPFGLPRYPINDVINQSTVFPLIYDKFKSYFLPQAYPEGSPLHPAYGAGHATLAGACVTILKAWFDSEQPFVNFAPFYQSNAEGTLLFEVGPLSQQNTVAEELNKLASNISIGRNIAGVHWRSDYTESVFLGEQVAIQLLRDYGFTYNEAFLGFKFRDFSGNIVTIGETRSV